MITAATFMAAIGDIRRFSDRKKLVGYLGLDPKVRQSGASAAARARISKQGSASARHALVEASWSAVRAPGPTHAFYERIRARRGHQAAIVAASRKLACLVWCLLTRGEDYAYAQPSLTLKKIRRLELAAGSPRGEAKPGTWAANKAMRDAERELARQAEVAYKRTVADWRRAQAKKGASVTPGARISKALEGQSRAADHKPLTSALRFVGRPRPNPTLAQEGGSGKSHLTFIRRAKRACDVRERGLLLCMEAVAQTQSEAVRPRVKPL